MFHLDVNNNNIIISDSIDGIDVELLLEENDINKFYNGRRSSRNEIPENYTFTHIKPDMNKFKLHTENALTCKFGLSVKDALNWLISSKCIKLKFESTILDRLRKPVKQYFKIGEYLSKINDMCYVLYIGIVTDIPLYPLGMVVASFRHRKLDTLWEGYSYPIYKSRSGVELMTFKLFDPGEYDVTEEPLWFGTAIYGTEKGFTQEVIYGYFKPFTYEGWYLTTMEDFDAFAVAKRTHTYKNGKLIKTR